MSKSLKVDYISVSGELVFENCKIIDPDNAEPHGIPIFYKRQIAWKTGAGDKMFCDAEDILVIGVSKRHTNVPRNAQGQRMCHVSCYGVVYENAFIVTNPYEAFGIPPILGPNGIGIITNVDGWLLTTKDRFCLFHCSGPTQIAGH
jgi:hypothetical protein